MKTWVLRISIALIVLVVLALVTGFIFIDKIAKEAIERGSQYALGVETSLESVDLGVFSGKFSLSELHARNPEGFSEGDFFALGGGRLSVGVRSLLGDTVRVDELVLAGIDLRLELQNTRSNYGEVLNNLKRFEGEKKTGGEEGEKEAGGNKRLIIRRLLIDDVEAGLKLESPELGIDTESTVRVPTIELTDIGVGQGGVSIAELSSIVMTRIIEAVVRSGGDFPAQLRRAVEGELNRLIAEQGGAVSVEDLEEKGKEEAEKAVEKAVDDATKKLGDLLGGDDDN